ncbi:MAG: hypothetical protein WA517_06750 [Candidatus Acidiferrum sp.]
MSCILPIVNPIASPATVKATEVAQPPSTHMIRIAMLSALGLFAIYSVLLSPVAQELRNKGIHITLFAEVLPYGFVLLPYLTAFVLITWGKNQKLISSGAGVALALFGGFVLVSPGALMMVFVWAGLSRNPMLLAALGVLVVLILVSVWVVWCAIRQMKNSSGAFWAGACAAALYLFIGSPAVKLKQFRAQQHAEAVHTAETLNYYGASATAHKAIASLTGCLIQYQAAQPKREFPASVSEIPEGPGCDTNLAKPGAIPYYTITYSPQRDPAGGVTNFQLLAIPIQKGLDRVNPILCDKRGIIFVYERWFAMNQGENLQPVPDEEPNDFWASKIFSLRTEINSFMKNSGDGRPPSSLSQLRPANSNEKTDDPDSRRADPYVLKYFAPRDKGLRYAISADCQSYGNACIRSFFLDFDGEVHQTPEPRPATAHDKLIPDCEKFAQSCRDIDWPIPSPAGTTAH